MCLDLIKYSDKNLKVVCGCSTVMLMLHSCIAISLHVLMGVPGLLDQGGEKPTSKVELLAMLRDQKRRRQSYRAKNVHVTKKSYTEVNSTVLFHYDK